MSKEFLCNKDKFTIKKERNMIRLEPIEKPFDPRLKVAYIISKIQFGKVLSALKYVYSKSVPVMMASLKIVNVEKKLSLPKSTKHFIRYYTSHINECPFCSNSIEYLAAKDNVEFLQWKEFMNFRNSNKFSEKEKALLTYLEEINSVKSVTEDTFSNLRKFYSEKEVVEITWINATENYFNLMAKPLGLVSDGLIFKKS